MSNRPVVRWATPADVSGITEVFARSFDDFPPWEVSEGQTGFVRWMTESRGSLECRPSVSVLDGKIVGAETTQLRPALMEGQPVMSSRGPYGAMHPGMRGPGLLSRAEHVRSGRRGLPRWILPSRPRSITLVARATPQSPIRGPCSHLCSTHCVPLAADRVGDGS